MSATACLRLQRQPRKRTLLYGGKKKPHRGDRDGARVWQERGRALAGTTQIQANGLDSQRSPLVDQQLINPPEPLSGNNKLHPPLETLRGLPLGQGLRHLGCELEGEPSTSSTSATIARDTSILNLCPAQCQSIGATMGAPLWEQYLHCVTRSRTAAPCKLNQPRGAFEPKMGALQASILNTARRPKGTWED